ncbi:MAG: hypothetical protein NC489_43390 [Ruminococcus flavefaciens]|nr:hypothetical protein [Ruminococcus flavefaciens]
MDSLLLHKGYISLQGFDRIENIAYFHFLPTMHFSIMEKPSKAGISFDVVCRVKDRHICHAELAALLETVADKNIQAEERANGITGRIPFVHLNGFYLPIGIGDITEDAFCRFAGKLNPADIL